MVAVAISVTLFAEPLTGQLITGICLILFGVLISIAFGKSTPGGEVSGV
ncbi:hypothetical protein [Dyadobacter fermentans]|nr:hypothetical protein [Dyadobacter fermentans]